MKVILLSDVKKVGRKDAVIEVANGYAQNVLLPQKLAVPATRENVARREKELVSQADRKAFKESLFCKHLEALRGKSIKMRVRANESGTLFETIRPKQIAEAIQEEFGFFIPESAFSIEDIKKTGEYEANISAGRCSANFTLLVG